MAFVNKYNDLDLVKRLQQNEEEALTIIYKEYWEIMYVAAYNLVKDRSVCEDIVQEVFISLWQRREKLQIKTSLKSYLYTSTVYKVYDHFSKNKKMLKDELFDNFENKIEASNPETKLMHEELIRHLDAIVDSLPDKCREVYKLSRENMLSNKEIAEQLNISQRTVEGHISKALKILKESLGVAVSIEFIVYFFR
ncbi:RNA polymerase sigma-70 factor, ECF subfamily [Flavobacterium flevense]|uniref:RNA polymerase sigma-70 factor n=1 Tax=Flavobacterium flevense TaxID=983 RepID=A0A4Y4AV36_9FLAO|nr:RNA polymerase sigma-70 factor [Flavobacterium flevense]GEC71219.1 RNA polymerase sigma-70 factor [Flavobacterium flevense]SHL30890.1 RNA polymerase sigma-70 factor, ECF subfamily [Flavobacterium flevense]